MGKGFLAMRCWRFTACYRVLIMLTLTFYCRISTCPSLHLRIDPACHFVFY